MIACGLKYNVGKKECFSEEDAKAMGEMMRTLRLLTVIEELEE
jgi:hypothetical protein